MKRDREKLIDFLLGELPEGEARELETHLRADPSWAAERERYVEAMAVIRAAAAAGWNAPRRRTLLLRPALAAAAVLLLAVGLFLLNGSSPGARAVYEPDGAYGYLRAEETDAAGRTPAVAPVERCTLRSGRLQVAVLGSDRSYPVEPGEAIPADSKLESAADSGARIDLPHGGVLFLGPVSTIQLKKRSDGATALRLTEGVACTVKGGRDIHLAVEGTDLLLDQTDGATFVRFSPAEVICLRGSLVLRYDEGKSFRVPPGERLPAACTHEPRTVPVTDDELELDWYRDMIYADWRVERIAWERPGHSRPLRAGADALLYLRLIPRADGPVRVRFGGEPREFEVRKGAELQLRLRFADLGVGPRLEVTPADAVREARLFEAKPR